jgi:hypothetical protein
MIQHKKPSTPTAQQVEDFYALYSTAFSKTIEAMAKLD